MAADQPARDEYEYIPRAGEMFAWLAHASEDVWCDCVERVNPDDDTWLLLWMVDQPQCTEQLAAHIFWWSGPAHVAEHLFGGGSLNPNDESDMLIDLILRNWRKDLYRKGDIGFRRAERLLSDDACKIRAPT